MIPTIKEKQWLQEYLYKALRYRETYNEIYDHILTALEHEPAANFFETTVSNVIEKEFGGSNNMIYMEVKSKRLVNMEIKTQYRRKFADWFKLPLVAYTLTIAAFNFYFWGSKSPVLGIMGLIFFIAPLILMLLRRVIARFKYDSHKASIRDGAFDWLVYRYSLIRMFLLWPVVNMIFYVFKTVLKTAFHISDSELLSNLAFRSIETGIFMLFIISNLAIIQMYIHEFKTQKAIA
ncbi:MAG: hypothetical protein EOP47_03220 [Sphingobacteriaceae bacterium]|nr:MAG: hypothetical protein EOP47_03220 [Sphingobacteriaceae bacterium]